MEMDLIYYELKLQSLLEKFLENGYHIKNDVYFNRLLSFLNGKENKELAEALLKLPLMAEWILRAVKLWEDKCQIPDRSISSFALQLLGLISRNEVTFTNLLKHNVYERLIQVSKVENTNSDPIVKLGFTKLLMSLTGHNSGLHWLLQTYYWEFVHSSLKSQTIYIVKECHLFIASFLNEISKLNHEEFCKIWQIIIQPLLVKPDRYLRTQDSHFEACDEKIEKFVGPTVSLMCSILEYLIDKCIERESDHLKYLKSILQTPKIIESLTNYIHIVRNENLTYEMSRLWILLLYFSMVVEVKNGVIKPDIDKEFLEQVFSLLSILFKGLKNTCVLKLLYCILVHWYKLKSKLKVIYTIESHSYKFEDQFLFIHLCPNLMFCRSAGASLLRTDDHKEEFYTKVTAKMSRMTLRYCYKWRDSLQREDVLYNIGPKSISYFIQLKPFLSRNDAVMIFQAFLCQLIDTKTLIESNNHYIPVFSKCEVYLKTMLQLLAELIVDFNISWKDSIQSLCVFKATVEFLNLAPWSSKLIIAALNLIKVGISNYLSPDLALLIDEVESSAVWTLGSLLPAKLHDPEWSVRDSALEVVTVIAEVSNIEFPSFQKVLLRNDLCNLVLSMGLLDGESFVRASALRCLNQLVTIDAFWKNHLENQEVLEKMMKVLKYETEGIVRAQAATLLTTLVKYQSQGIDEAQLKEIYTSMCSSAIDDLHWEVRLNCLVFWGDRVEQKLRGQGMVDGAFPKCTFSTESRKIVNLTDIEIKKRIMIVLDQLSEMGCLNVLKHAVSDDCDLQVSKRGLEISKKLTDLIEKYNMADDINIDENGPLSNDSCYSSFAASTPSPSERNHDEVIEQILQASDNHLLTNIYNPGNNHSTVIYQTENPSRHMITTIEFIRLTKKNYKSLISERENWINSLDSLSSLLNDMLESYELTETNAMDCY